MNLFKWHKRKLTTEIVRNLIIVVVTLVLLLGSFSIVVFMQSAQREVDLRNRVLIKTISKHVNQRIHEIQMILFIINKYIEMNEKVGKDWDYMVSSLLDIDKYLLKVQILDRNGVVKYIYPYDELYMGIDMSGYEFVRDTFLNKSYVWSTSFISPQLNQPVVTLNLPYKDGIISIYLELTDFGALIEGLDLGEHSSVMLIDQNGVYIAHSDRKQVLQRNYDSNYREFKSEFKGNILTRVESDDNEKYIYNVTFLDNPAWAIQIKQAAREVYGRTYHLIVYYIVIVFIILVIVLIFSSKQIRKITDSLKRFFENIRIIESGKYYKIDTKEHYIEFEEISTKFSQMAESIKFREEELTKFKSIIEQANYGAAISDVTGNLIFMNRYFAQMHGYEVDELLGKNIKVLHSARQLDEANRLFTSILVDGGFSGEEVGHVRKNGEEFPTIMSALRLDNADGKAEFVSATAIDITEKKRMEGLMIQTEKMMSVGGLAAGMAHEINNPLAAIIQGIQNTFRRVSPLNSKNQEVAKMIGVDLDRLNEYLNIREINMFLNGIRDAGMRAADIVQNMLNFSRQSEMKLYPEDPNIILDETIELASHDYDLKKKYDFKKIRIVKDFDSSIEKISCVKSEIQQVILNLLKNGAEIMNEKLALCIEDGVEYVPTFFIRTYHKGKFVYIEIEDNGPGISKEDISRVFEPFYTTKPVGKGTGLGLSVSYFIITQNHNGRIWVESKEGKGAKFIIEFPL